MELRFWSYQLGRAAASATLVLCVLFSGCGRGSTSDVQSVADNSAEKTPENSGQPSSSARREVASTTLDETTAAGLEGDVEGEAREAAAETDKPPASEKNDDATAPSESTADVASDGDDSAGSENGAGDLAAADGDTADSKTGDENRDDGSDGEATERLLLCAPSGPLIVDLLLTIDGAPYRHALNSLVEKALLDADTDGDGQPTWEELTFSPRFIHGQLGNLAIEDDRGRREVIRLYDVDRDGRVDADELPRFLTRNAGGARPFSLRRWNSLGEYQRSLAPLRQLLDVDQDGALSGDELNQADKRLSVHDANGDGIVTALEVGVGEASMFPGMRSRPRRQRRSGPPTALHLDKSADWDAILYVLQERYGDGRRLQAGSYALAPARFAQLDSDGDGLLNAQETAALATAPPHIVLAVSFDRRSAESQSKLELRHLDPQLSAPPPTVYDTRITLALADGEIEFFINDTIPAADFAAQAAALLAQRDADKNGYLEKEELESVDPTLAAQFAAADSNADGKLYPDELAPFLAERQGSRRAQIRARAADSEAPLLAALDTNDDGRLAGREISEAPRRLSEFDVDDNGRVTADETPGGLTLALVRGDAQQGDGLFTPPPVAPRGEKNDAPDWFLAMDANGDGEVSEREFLGPAEQFGNLDANADGFFEVTEIPADL